MKPVGKITDSEHRALVEHRINRAYEARDDAQIAFANLRLTNAVNRCYYAMFYMVSALALLDGFTTSKHKQLHGWFNRTYIATHILGEHLKNTISSAFDSRSEGDYQDWKTFTADEVQNVCDDTDEFLTELKAYIESRLSVP
jgi:uncharacterized protein